MDLDAQYTFTNSHYTSTTTGDPSGVQLGGIPRNLATVALSWRPVERWSLTGSLRYNDAMFLDVGRTLFQPSFTLVGLSTTYQVTPRVSLYGSAVNLAGNVYTDNATTSASSETLGMPRAFTGGLRWKF